MPYVHISTSAELSAENKSALLEKIALLLPILPGKNRNNAMVQLDGNCFMATGDPSISCAFAEIRLYGKSPAAAKEKFAASLTELLSGVLGVPTDHVYLNYFEMDHWGMNGTVI